MYAIIEDSGTQIKVQQGDVITVDLRDLPENAKSITFDRVLALGGEGDINVGQPYVSGASVTLEITEPVVKGDKLYIYKFKPKKQYKRKTGHRQRYTSVRVTAING